MTNTKRYIAALTLLLAGSASAAEYELDVLLNKLGEQMGKPKAGFSATGIIDRTEFNLKTFAPLIGSEVTLAIEVEADRL